MGRALPGAKCCHATGPDCGESSDTACLCGEPDTADPVYVDVILPVDGLAAPQRCWVRGSHVTGRLAGGYFTHAL